MAKQEVLEIMQGATSLLPFTCFSDEDDPDFTGWKVIFVAKKSFDDDNADALINFELEPDPVTGLATQKLTDEDTADYEVGEYIYQAIVVDDAGNVGKSETGSLFVVATAYKGAIA